MTDAEWMEDSSAERWPDTRKIEARHVDEIEQNPPLATRVQSLHNRIHREDTKALSREPVA